MDSVEVDPMMAGAVAIFHFIRHEKPFSESDWRDPNTQIPSQHLDLIRVSVVGYQLFTYLKLIEDKFGPEISRIVREHQIIALNRLPDQMGDQMCQLLDMIHRAHESAIKNPMTVPGHPDVEVPIEWRIALSLLYFEMKDSPYYLPLERRKADNFPEIRDDLDRVFAMCLAYGKDSAVEVFRPMVEKMEFKPETVSGLRRESSGLKADILYTELTWSENPGCFERHLQRKYMNPLFPPTSRIVTQDEVNAARARDASEAQVLWTKIMKHAESARTGHFTVAQLAEHRKRMDDLMQEAAETGDSQAESATAKLYWAIIGDMEKAMRDNPKGAEMLQKANENYVKVGLASNNRFVAQFCRQDSPIKPEEVLLSLLSEDLDTIRKFMIFVEDDEELRNLHKRLSTDAVDLVNKVQATGAILPQIEEKLEALGIQPNPLERHE